jgi:hypothetical protein
MGIFMKRDRFGFVGDAVVAQFQPALAASYARILGSSLSTPTPTPQEIGKKGRHLTGLAFAQVAGGLATDKERQELAVSWLLSGERPKNSLAFVPVRYTAKDAKGVDHEVEIRVAPDYLAVGTEEDHLVASLGLPNALRVARELGFALPTAKLVDVIWEHADFRYTPAPLPSAAGSTMRKPPYQLQHRDLIEAEGKPPAGTLVAGHKKDVVLSSKLTQQPGRLAIYGWHRADGRPIQGVSLFHGADYADYSHGIRPISPVIYVDGRAVVYPDVLMDPVLHSLVSRDPAFDPEAVTTPGQPWGMV